MVSEIVKMSRQGRRWRITQQQVGKVTRVRAQLERPERPESAPTTPRKVKSQGS